MRITPLDIQNKDFPLTTKGKGYKVSEVNYFLKLIVEEMEDLMRENNNLQEKINGHIKENEHLQEKLKWHIGENENLQEKLKGYKNLEAMVWNFVEQCIKSKTKENQEQHKD